MSTPTVVRRSANDTLQHCSGTSSYTRYIGGLVLTDGVKELATSYKCFWILDIIASYQPQLCKRGEEGFQLWKLRRVDETQYQAIVVCEDGNGNVLVEQTIEHTDIEADDVKLYCMDSVILLPSEY